MEKSLSIVHWIQVQVYFNIVLFGEKKQSKIIIVLCQHWTMKYFILIETLQRWTMITQQK